MRPRSWAHSKQSALWRPAVGAAPGADETASMRGTPCGSACLLLRQNGVLQLLRDPRLDDGLGGNLDLLARGRIASQARLALLDDQLHHPREHELARAPQLLLGQRVQLVEELPRLRPLDLEAIREVREEFGFAHPAGLCHRLFPLLERAHLDPQYRPRARAAVAEK